MPKRGDGEQKKIWGREILYYVKIEAKRKMMQLSERKPPSVSWHTDNQRTDGA